MLPLNPTRPGLNHPPSHLPPPGSASGLTLPPPSKIIAHSCENTKFSFEALPGFPLTLDKPITVEQLPQPFRPGAYQRTCRILVSKDVWWNAILMFFLIPSLGLQIPSRLLMTHVLLPLVLFSSTAGSFVLISLSYSLFSVSSPRFLLVLLLSSTAVYTDETVLY